MDNGDIQARAAKLRDMSQGGEDELARITAESEAAGELAGAVGGDYQLGGLTLPARGIGFLALLQMIDSPFIRGDDSAESTYELAEIAETLYVLAEGRDATAPICGLARKRDALERAKDIASQSPEHYDVYLTHAQGIEEAHVRFRDSALAWFERSGIGNIQEAAEVVVRMVGDMFAGMALMPEDPMASGDSKKN